MWPTMLDLGKRTYDSLGRVCRPADKYNERRAIIIMKSAYEQYRNCVYRSYQEPFSPIDGEWRYNDEVVSYCEIKSHAGKSMSDTTILNLRKWKSICNKMDSTNKPLIFIAQYENKVGWADVSKIRRDVEALTPYTIHDSKSVQRSTSTELVWRIPTDLLTIVDEKAVEVSEKDIDILREMEREIRQTT